MSSIPGQLDTSPYTWMRIRACGVVIAGPRCVIGTTRHNRGRKHVAATEPRLWPGWRSYVVVVDTPTRFAARCRVWLRSSDRDLTFSVSLWRTIAATYNPVPNYSDIRRAGRPKIAVAPFASYFRQNVPS